MSDETADPLARLIQPLGLEATAFPPESRYHGLPIARLRRDDSREVVHLTRRFLPPPERLAEVRRHTVVEGDRLDRIAADHLGDAKQSWRLADANRALHPAELETRIGRRLRVTLPDGVPGTPRE